MATCSNPLASAASVPGVSCRCSDAPRAVGGAPRIDDDQPAAAAALLVEILHDRRHGLGRIAADQQDRVRAARCRRAETAGRDRGRRRADSRPPPTPCRSGRCSRYWRCAARPARTCRADRPSRWSARRRRTRRSRRGRATPGSRARRSTTRSNASSQLAGRSGAPLRVAHERRRESIRGMSNSAAVQPLRQSPPLLVGKSRAATVKRSSSGTKRHSALQGAIRTMGFGLLGMDAAVHASTISDAHRIASLRHRRLSPQLGRADEAATADTTSKRLARRRQTTATMDVDAYCRDLALKWAPDCTGNNQ